MTRDNRLQRAPSQIGYDVVDFHVMVSDVPMSVCAACGHRVIPEPVAVEIEDYVRHTVAALRNGSIT